MIIAGHAFMQNVRRGHYKLAVDAPPAMRVAAAFTELAVYAAQARPLVTRALAELADDPAAT